MTDGIPIVYYGLEQGFSGGSDPANREALWPSAYANSTGVQIITKLNKLRNWMIKIDGRPSVNGVHSNDRKQEIFHARNVGDDISTNSLRSPITRPRQGVANTVGIGKRVIGKRVDEGYMWQSNEKLYKRDDETGPRTLGFIDSPAYVVGANKQVMAIVRDSVIGVVTNIGSPVSGFDLYSISKVAHIHFTAIATEHELCGAYSIPEERSDYRVSKL